MEKEMATHYSILAWRIPWTEDPVGLEPIGLQRVGNDQVTNTFPTLEVPSKFAHSYYGLSLHFSRRRSYLLDRMLSSFLVYSLILEKHILSSFLERIQCMYIF